MPIIIKIGYAIFLGADLRPARIVVKKPVEDVNACKCPLAPVLFIIFIDRHG